ncbi:sulfotransferase family 2 domain-containing protein [Sphingomonas sp. ID1715]|nr:sulfotransferase family 2 domain-containing protein [Sphingomonas sp. ID1715]NNM77741.1 sulfotransferase family 2 domain-containing protein [Sphingomonas sp. ID1715]
MRRHLARSFGVKLSSDIYERICDLGVTPPLDRERRRRLAVIRAAGILFIHIPKNAGMSVSSALYARQVKHSTVRYYQRVAPDLIAQLRSFAVLRDPIERFLSAYHYARAGGSADNRVSLPFRRDYRAFESIEDALDHIERAELPYGVDHIFRPQSWYILDASGKVAVDDLLLMGDVSAYLAQRTGRPLPWVNCGDGSFEAPTSAQVDRLRRLYRRDFELFEALCR